MAATIAFVPRAVDHEDRRRHITHSVWHLLSTGGPAAVTLRAVAAEAGVSVGRIQHYFASKEEMVRHGCRSLIEASAHAFRTRTSGADPVQALRDLVTHAIPMTTTARVGTSVWHAYLAASVGDPEIAALLRRAKRGEQQHTVRLVRDAQRRGRIARELEPGALARRWLSMADGLSMRVVVGGLGARQAVRLLEQELDAVLRSAAGPRAGRT